MDTPIAFFAFNRPETTARVFERIVASRPSRLLIVADGPRHEAEAAKCVAVREIVSHVDWPCDVSTSFSTTNLGCRVRVQTGLDWVFEQVEEAIILEDDTLPDPSFFPFCAELLSRYRNDERIALVSGCAIVRGSRRYSYRFSRFTSIWGWATWRRVWQSADKSLTGWPDWDAESVCSDPRFRVYWDKQFNAVRSGLVDTWDCQFFFSCLRKGLLSAVSNTSLITNLGIGANATHAARDDHTRPLPSQSIQFPLKHPPVEIDTKSDNTYWRKRLRPQMFPSFTDRAKGKLRLLTSKT